MYWTITIYGCFFQSILSTKANIFLVTGLIRFRSPLLTESRLISFPLGYLDVSVPLGSLYCPMYSDSNTCLQTSGFPHSEISGSKPVCRLPEAYRRLQRPSSPSVAKAFTVCTYFLNHVTLNNPQKAIQRYRYSLLNIHTLLWFTP